ncbi:MAG: thiamine diphosphokinase, partial [Desulfomonilia bacterium]
MFLIVSGGDAPDPAFLQARAEKARMIIAADRGAGYCLRAGVRPDVVVGDMDSISPAARREAERSGIPFIRHSTEKDKTDTQLALDIALDRGASCIEMLACIGDRFDHSLANVHLLYAALKAGVDAAILTPSHRIFLVDSAAGIEGMKGALLSLLPLSLEVRGVCLSGFQWPLKDAVMEMGNPYGISNRVVSEQARICVREGVLAAVL